MLADYHGALMADALAQYQQIVATNGIWRLGCWAHVRRGFYDARLTDRRAAEMVLLIRKIYAAERRATERGLTGDAFHRWRWRLRQRYTARVLTIIKQRLDDLNPAGTSATRALPNTPLGKAVVYALNQWDLLERFVSTGDWPLDNNAAENAQRPIAVGRKNHLFMGSEGGGEMAAKFYSLIQSCRLQHIDPVAYLKDVCQRMLAGSTDYAALTPLAWSRSRPPSPA
jgi:transposase